MNLIIGSIRTRALVASFKTAYFGSSKRLPRCSAIMCRNKKRLNSSVYISSTRIHSQISSLSVIFRHFVIIDLTYRQLLLFRGCLRRTKYQTIQMILMRLQKYEYVLTIGSISDGTWNRWPSVAKFFNIASGNSILSLLMPICVERSRLSVNCLTVADQNAIT